jgi:hypothetical protein
MYIKSAGPPFRNNKC